MEHLSENKIIAYMLDLSDGINLKNAEDHIKTCNECEKRYNTLLPIIKPYVKDEVQFPGMLKKRILNSAIELKDSERESNFGDIVRMLWKGTRYYATIAASAIILIIIGISLFFQINTSNAYLQIAHINGKVDIDAIPARLFDSVSSGNTISTDDNSAMMLRFLRNYKLILLSKSTLTIDKAKVKKNKNLEFKYSLSKGTLLYKNNHNNPVRYVFSTPHALIKSQDADLMLQASKKASNILLMKGKLIVQDKNSSNKITIDSPGRYIITDNNGIKMTRVIDPALHDLQKIEEAFDANNDDDTLASRDCFQTDDSLKNQANGSNDAANELYEQVSQHTDSDLY
jgi:hypothetical protein